MVIRAVLGGLEAPEKPVDILGGLAVAFLTYRWCYYDAAEHGRHLGITLAVLIVMLAPVGLSAYLLSRRRWATLARAVGLFAAAMVASVIILVVTYWAVYGHPPEP